MSARIAADAAARCRALRIEPPTPDRIARVVRTAVRAYEDGRTATVHARLTPAMRVSLDALLQPAEPEGTVDAEDGAMPDGRVKGLTPYKVLCKHWTSEPQRFKLDPLQQCGDYTPRLFIESNRLD